MLYQLKHGESEIMLRQQIRNEKDLPDFIKNKPKLIHDGLGFYLKVFFELETERPINGFAVVAIPISKMINYAQFIGYESKEDIQDFVYLMREIDKELCKYYREKSNEKSSYSN